MKTRIDRKFEQLREDGRKGFIAFITAGDPTMHDTVDNVLALEKAGADIVELGIPFSDPLADGRVNQEAAERALHAGATLDKILTCVENIRRRSDVPLLFFSYLNPLIARGFEPMARAAARAGIDGYLVLDLPVEESATHRAILAKNGLNNICLVTPTSPPERIKRIVEASTGFVYCVSREGVTGMQKKLSQGAVPVVRDTKRFTSLPVAIGFGISTPAQARAAAEAADAIIVGSAIVDSLAKRGRKTTMQWIRELVDAVKGVR
ncbi:MAG TPA: tryptophan synthase subunit alpha [Kiritimatiellia bacterium]|nr:tryptophan synthase subunit alpha [Kiritimatiellia bacterium]